MKKLLLATLLASSCAFAGQALSIKTISSQQAQNAIEACTTLASKNKWAMSIVIVDRGANIKAMSRMDGALNAASTGATLKAQTSLSWFSPTQKVAQYVKAEPNFKQFPGLLPIGGGIPLFSKDKQIIGAVGVAGSMVENDIKCAQAAANAINK